MALGSNRTMNPNILQEASIHYKMCILTKDFEKAEKWLDVIKNSKFTEATKKRYLKSCEIYLESRRNK